MISKPLIFQHFKHLLLLSFALIAVAIVIRFNMKEHPIDVRVKTVQIGVAQSTVANTRAGDVKACRRSHLSMRIGGTVESLYVKKGARVKAEDLLLQLWNEDLKAQLQQAKANVERAQISIQQACLTANHTQLEAQRQISLLKRKLASQEVVDNANNTAELQKLACQAAGIDLEVAKAAVQLQKSLLNQTLLKAPFNGVIAEINGELGEFITPSPAGIVTPPAVDLIDDSCLYVSAPIDEVDAQNLEVGMRVDISLDAFRGKKFAGRISRIAPYVLDLEKQARTVEVEVKFDETPSDINLLIGYSTDITIILEEKPNVILLPVEALFNDSKVYRFNSVSQRVELLTLELGIGNWSQVEVISGLSEGDQVVTSLEVKGLTDGAPVRVNM